jgi:hypothetical protein
MIQRIKEGRMAGSQGNCFENDKKDADKKILRRFRYSYYWDLIQVETHHIATDVG